MNTDFTPYVPGDITPDLMIVVENNPETSTLLLRTSFIKASGYGAGAPEVKQDLCENFESVCRLPTVEEAKKIAATLSVNSRNSVRALWCDDATDDNRCAYDLINDRVSYEDQDDLGSACYVREIKF